MVVTPPTISDSTSSDSASTRTAPPAPTGLAAARRGRAALLAWLGMGPLGGLGGLPGCATGSVGTVDPSLEMPAFRVLEAEGPLEVRYYEPHIVAEATTEGDYDRAARDGFRLLASYIFGNNASEARVAMTAPVASSPQASAGTAGTATEQGTAGGESDGQRGVRIAMTAPVSTSPTGTGPDLTTLGASGRWTTRFLMPSRYTLETLPVPRDPRVTFREEPARCVGAIAFSGLTTEARVAEMRSALLAWLEARGHAAGKGESVARYNDPFTLPWRRRNEVWVELDACANEGARSDLR